MNLIPLVGCELRVALRRPSTYRLKLASSAGAVILGTWLLLVSSGWGSATVTGLVFFRSIAFLGLILALVSGLFLAADGISQERREGTLNLLFLTDLNPRDVVFGKVCAKAILPLYSLLALFPTLMISVVVGGITAAEFARVFLLWLNALLVALSVGLAISTFCWQQRTANVSASFVLLALTVGFPWIGVSLTQKSKSPIWELLLSLPSPGGLLWTSFTHPLSTGWFAFGLLANQFLSWILLRLASRRVTAYRTFGPSGRAQKAEATSPEVKAGAKDRRLAPELLEQRPVEWLELQKYGNRFWLKLGAAIFGCLLLCIPVDPFGSSGAINGFILLLGVQTVSKLWVASHAAYGFAADRRTGALESLLGTKIGTDEMTTGMFRGFLWRFAGPLWILTFFTMTIAFWLVSKRSFSGALLVSLSAVMLWWDSYCIFWVGLFQGLVARTPALGAFIATARILLLPIVWFAIAAQVFHRSSIAEFLILWVMIVVPNHLAFLLNVKGSFQRFFRVLALKPFGEKNPVIENKWSPINWDEEPIQDAS